MDTLNIPQFKFVPEGNYDDRGFLQDEDGQIEFDTETVYVRLCDVQALFCKPRG